MSLFDFCSVNPIIPWLLPFLLGLTLGYLLWSKYKSMVDHAERSNADLRANLDAALADNQYLRQSKETLDADLNHVKSKLRSIETSLSDTAAQLGTKVGVTVESKSQKPHTLDATLEKKSEDTHKLSATSSLVSKEEAIDSASSEFNSKGSLVTLDIENQSTNMPTTSLVSSNHLQVLESIGPKVEEILNSHGIHDFDQLSQQTPQKLRDILDTYGTKYRMIDPEPWIKQSKLAHAQDWDGLVVAQREQYKLKNPKVNHLVDTKIEKHFMKLGILKKYTQDDLKAVEGIGPKIEQLLHADGIKTWAQLANASVDRLKAILTKAGPRYMLADPMTWPRQAALANEGQWAALDDLQKALNGGKEK
jgi:predicted flap endonuclease-1-like 5' DNA nuclease